ncbi:putative mfs dha1 multidrug resistance protein [Erysiphe necator]|uniref:Putative mfs dha1 multidrug resistance protein n=1 Tax=Uncinula necator TaxID=52586 RepID=A0A0B1P107_UNCNE|nr:putative mfs dha1 multidrug resistance protein [Erysiphe necator]
MQSILQYRRLRSDPPLTQCPSYRHEIDSSNLGPNEHIYVDWDSSLDPSHPRNWTLAYRIWVCALVSMNVFALDWCSAADSQASTKISSEFVVSRRIESIGSALFVFGIASGALFAGPITETVGRNPVYIGGRLIHLIFILGTALAQNISTQLICRFFAGIGASTILAIHGASIADLFGQEGRSLAWPFVALWSFLGTSFSPIVGAWIAQSTTVSWRWTDWIAVIMSAITFMITIIWLPETFAPILLKWKASKIRKTTGNKNFIAPIESQSSFSKRLIINLNRALIMSTREYIVILLGLWLIVVYIVVFGFVSGMNVLFGKTYSFSQGLVGTSFAAIAVGVILNTMLSHYFAYQHHNRTEKLRNETSSDSRLPPEYRLLSAFPVAFSLPISLFWLGWTNYDSISPWSGLGAVALFGFSWAGIYVSIYHYIFDTYSIYAGSALASITCGRYLFAGGIQIISEDMWGALGVHWTCTLLGCIATILVPVPFILYIMGERIRKSSKFASESLPKNDDSSTEKHVA